MSDIFALDERGTRTITEEARFNAIDISQADLPFTQNVGRGVGYGIMRGGARVGQFIGMAGGALAAGVELGAGLAPGTLTDPYFKAVDEYANNAVDYWTPHQGEVGKAGQILGGLGEIALPLMAGAGNPSLLIGAQEIGTAADLTRQGVDAGTAIGAGLVQGAATAVGFKIPFLGGTLGSRMVSGAGGNLIVNTASAAATRELLKSQGYVDQAASFNPLDPGARFVDVLTGLAFGAVAHGLSPSQVHATATAADAKHFQSDTAPGIPADVVSSQAHQEAMDQAVRQLIEGDSVTAPAGSHNALFVPREQAPLAELPPELAELDQARAPIPESLQNIPRGVGLSEADTAIETRFREQILANPEKAMADYAALPDSDGGRILNTDIARELSPDYLADRTKSAAVHEPASALIKALYARKLAEAPAPGELPVVVFSAGGTGAGKTTGLELASEHSNAVREAQIVYDSNLNTAKSAIARIEQALAAQKDVVILYTFRDPVDALIAGALPRAMRQEGEFGSGRTVPIAEHARTHLGAAEVVRQVAARYAKDPRVDIRVVDNSKGKNQATETDLNGVPRLDIGYNALVGKLNEALDQQLAKRKISEAVYRGFRGAGEAAPGESAAPVRGPPGLGSGEGPSQPAVGQTVFTSTGRAIQVTPKVVEASSLVTSDTAGYPAGLQPRQRGERVASDAQIAEIAQNLKPELLGPSATADTGAPIVGPDNAVESGNGRVLAIIRAYEQHGPSSDAYRAYLESQGYDLTGIEEPILVRERTTPMTPEERQAFAVEANKPATMAMSALERAQADAVLLDEAVLDKLKGGELTDAKNSDFLRAFLAKLAPGERNAMMDASGNISQDGIRRAQAAILAKAYGRTPEAMSVLARMLESNDNEARSVLGALTDAAPAVAKLADAVARGDVLPQFDVSSKITKAVEELAVIRGRGQAVGEALKQQDLLAPRDPIVDAILKAFFNRQGTRLASREQIAATLGKYAKQAAAVPRSQGDMFGAAERTPEALLAKAGETPAEAAGIPQEDLFAVKAAREVAADPALTIPTGDVNPDGTPVTVSAAEALARSDQEIAEAQNDAKGFEAAVDCYLQKGAA